MNHENTIMAKLKLRHYLFILLIIPIAILSYEKSLVKVTKADLYMQTNTHVGAVALSESGEIIEFVRLSDSESVLDVKILGQADNIPWTAYLPFYQFGSITSRVFFEANIPMEQQWRGEYVTYEETLSRVGILPDLFRSKKINKILLNAITQTIDSRQRESQRRPTSTSETLSHANLNVM